MIIIEFDNWFITLLSRIDYIIDFIEKSIVADDLYSYYCTSISDEPNSFRLRAMYAEE